MHIPFYTTFMSMPHTLTHKQAVFKGYHTIKNWFRFIFKFNSIAWTTLLNQYISVQFSHSVESDSLPPHWLQHARLHCSSPTPRVYSNSCPSRWWCHPNISSSIVPFSCLQSFPASGSFSIQLETDYYLQLLHGHPKYKIHLLTS